jgi:hypothetical protein
MLRALLVVALLPASALAQTIPIQQVGKSCPLGYYSSSGYCVPSSGNRDKWSVGNPANVPCPLGTYKSGSYCTKSYGNK